MNLAQLLIDSAGRWPDHLTYAGPLDLTSGQFDLSLTSGEEVPEGFQSLKDLLLDWGPFSVYDTRDEVILAVIYKSGTSPLKKTGNRG